MEYYEGIGGLGMCLSLRPGYRGTGGVGGKGRGECELGDRWKRDVCWTVAEMHACVLGFAEYREKGVGRSAVAHALRERYRNLGIMFV